MNAQSRTLVLAMASVGIGGLAVGSHASLSPRFEAFGKSLSKLTASIQIDTQKVASTLKGKMTELKELKDKASMVTQKIGTLAAEGKLPTSDEGIKVLQDLVDQLKQTNEALKKVQEDVEGILGWIEGQNENLPIMQADIAALKKIKMSFYTQFQWQDTDSEDGASKRNDGFQLRRFRVGATYTHDDRTSAKATFDVSTGSNRTAAELKDAFVTYAINPTITEVGTEVQFGQQPLPLGFELERSSSEREMPERALYNRRLFAGERDRGVMVRHGLGAGWQAQIGMWNGLTVTDPQASGFRDIDNKVAFTVGAKKEADNHEFGISALFGNRPSFTADNGVEVTQADRALVFIHGSYIGLFTEALTARAEVMFGKDRDPLGGIADPKFDQETDVLGWQAQLTYNLNPTNQLTVRYDSYDPDTDDVTGSNNRIDTWGVSYAHWFNPAFKLSLTYESPSEQGTEKRDNVWTLRSQFKL
ncbi:MAG: hypothetical protein H0W86_02265 [Armatimonadetes bacterium]|nr:hypothetical protein [Armatimonadota bacterium]